jgi:hypothetical protein
LPLLAFSSAAASFPFSVSHSFPGWFFGIGGCLFILFAFLSMIAPNENEQRAGETWNQYVKRVY